MPAVRSLAAALCVGLLGPLASEASGQALAAREAAPCTTEAAAAAQGRSRVGVALGGGSARGIAHVGVIRWFEEHRIPIDLLAGTSMGGLIGGSFAVGMDSAEIEAMLAAIDWDTMFGASTFEFQNVRRKGDSRAYPSSIQFGLKDGFKSPPSLNNGQQVDLLLARVTAPYFGITSFDELPTPFRVVAVDLITAQPAVLCGGSLARAMRATMSLPAVFPPVELDGRVLVDGGVLNNIPTDVVRGMGADRVIAVNVGDLEDLDEIDYSLFGLLGETLDTMMRSNSLKSVAAADIVINVPLKTYGSLDWRRYEDLIREGYQAADAMRDQLLPLAADEEVWQRWLAARAAARRTVLPTPTALTIGGAGQSDERIMRRAVEPDMGQPLDVGTLETDLVELGGLDRYETLRWSLARTGGEAELRIDALPKKYGPPFLFLGLSLENTTAREFRFSLSGRYLAFDVLGSGSELRIDGSVGSEPSLFGGWYRPIGSSSLFVEPHAGLNSRTLVEIEEDRVVATYRQVRTWAGADIGVNLGRLDDLRLGLRTGRLDATVRVGNPSLPGPRRRRNGGRSPLDARRAGQPGRSLRGAPPAQRGQIFHRRTRAARCGDLPANRGRHAGGVPGVLDPFDGLDRARPPVRAGRSGHVVRPGATSDRPVRARRPLRARRVQPGRPARGPLHAGERRVSPRDLPDAGFSRRPGLRRWMD